MKSQYIVQVNVSGSSRSKLQNLYNDISHIWQLNLVQHAYL